ncbi:hypothetical protein BN1049_02407 [Pseudomonas saudimassiliensis]|uniref:Type II toxin-antitoxin system RelE/ParE family toxin n=1 Tax=Pseudomonas saudimassiliensis TaxID=1461581 RepID=A0A078MI96_9PSED|nr:type II toxin-antitoxin system RelE/ParE family toxin [Pseudomonas saudimassiliensis]CEA06030.1 hypothetical protein BN1049_02407 [Pseudomonas saudimassiliensis]CEF27455.1 hypothetical protein BN1049_02407 [Pseudomonas saudimassiliensis]
MQVFKNRAFSKWATKEGLSDEALLNAVEEITRGLVDADLGGQVFMKRVAVGSRGKSGGVRTLLAYRAGSRAFFVYGFAKNVRTNISDKELKALKLYADVLLNYSRAELIRAAKSGVLIEVVSDE